MDTWTVLYRLGVCVYDVLLGVVAVLTGLQVDFVPVDTYERSVNEHFCVLSFSQNAWPKPLLSFYACCTCSVWGHTDFLYSPQALELLYISSYLFIPLHPLSYSVVWQTTCLCMCDSGVLNYTTRAVLIADLRPTNKQYSAQCPVPCPLLRSSGDRLMSSESLKRNRSKVSPVNEGDIDKRPCIDTLHESFSSPGDSDTAYNETTILEPDPEPEGCRLHSTVLDPAGSDDWDQSRQEMSIKDSLKEALKDPAVVQVLTNAITSSLRGKIHSLWEALERKEEKVAELQDRVDWLEQYSRRNNVRISGSPESTSAVENTDAVVKKVGEAIGVTITDEMIDRSHRVGKPGRMGRDVLVKFTSYRYNHLIMRARSGLKNKDAVFCRCRQAAGVSNCRSGYAGSITSGQGLR